MVSQVSSTANGPEALFQKCNCHHELLSSLVSLLEKMVEGVYKTSQWSHRQLCLVHEVISLVFRISVSDNYFDTHHDQCDHAYTFVFNKLKSLQIEGSGGMVTELLSYCEESDDSHDSS